MKSSYPQVTLLGSNSGNNIGDAALLSATLESLSQRMPTARFYVPTANPDFVNKKYGTRYNVQAFNIMPWNFALRFLGLPSLRCLWRSDIALICDGIIFGKRLFNPAFNMLITLAPLAIMAKLVGCKLACYSTGIGPFPKGRGSWLAKFLIQSCDLIMMREEDSKQLAEKIGVTKPIEITGDAAYLNPVSDGQRAAEICQKLNIDQSRPLLGINITSYMDGWMSDSGASSDPDKLISVLATGILRAQSAAREPFTPVVFSTHPMDVAVAQKLAALLKTVVVSNTEYLSHDVQAVMRRCELFIGMRFHSLVLSSAVYVPVMALVYAPKVKTLMETFQSTEYALTIAGLTPEHLAERMGAAWSERKALQLRQKKVVAQFKLGAERAADRVVEVAFPEFVSATTSKKDEALNQCA